MKLSHCRCFDISKCHSSTRYFQRQSHYSLDSWGNEEAITISRVRSRIRRFSSRPYQALYCVITMTENQGVCVYESFATSTSSVSRITEPAISHTPQAVGESCSCKERERAESSFKIVCSSEYTTSENLENSSCSAQFNKSKDFLTKWTYRSCSDSLWFLRT